MNEVCLNITFVISSVWATTSEARSDKDTMNKSGLIR